jgi:hypothetical protein
MLNYLNYLTSLSTLQLLLGIGAGVGLLILIKVILTPGGPRGRVQKTAGPWLMIPLGLAIGGGIIWVVVKMISGGGHIA